MGTLWQLVVVVTAANIPLLCSKKVTYGHKSSCSGVKNLRIGAFNIQTFGKTKYGREEIRSYLVDIVIKYDVILIQEIKDKSQRMIFKFLKDCQQHRNFSMALSKRLGRTNRYMEQYALLYDTNKIEVLNHTVYNDTLDVFHREPIVAHLVSRTKTDVNLTIIGIHTDPDDVPVELDKLEDVRTWSISQGYPQNSLMMGDFNADCSYLRKKEYLNLAISDVTNPIYKWLIPGSADTTVSDKTNCAYDRFIAVGKSCFFNTTIDRFDKTFGLLVTKAKKISDHYPISTIWAF